MQGLLGLGPGQFPSVLPNPPLLIRESYLIACLHDQNNSGFFECPASLGAKESSK